MTSVPHTSTADLVKSGSAVEHGGAYVPKAWFTDPFALLDSLGFGYKSSPSGLSYETLKQMAEQNVVIAAIIQTRVQQVASFTQLQPNKYSIGFKVAHKDTERRLTDGERNHIKDMEKFVLNCGVDKNRDRDKFGMYVKKIVRDRLTYDQMCTEVVPRVSGKPHSFYATPGNTMRLASPKRRKGTPLNARESGSATKYVQIVNGTIVNQYTPDELVFSIANPRTDLKAWGYGYSELEMLIKTVTRHLWAEEWNQNVFSQGSTQKGILNVKGNMPPQQMDAFKRMWLTQVSGVSNAWRTPIINSQDDLQWVSLQPTNEEMGYQQWIEYLIKIACAIYLIDPSEINFDVRAGVANKPMFMTTNEAQQKLSQDRGLRPLLGHVAEHINSVIERIDDDYEFKFVGIDAKTEGEAIELRLKELQSYKTLNEIREAEQLPPVPHGDIVPNPSYIGYRNQKELMAMQQGAAGGAGGPPQGGGVGMPGGEPDDLEDAVPGKAEDKARDGVLREIGKKPKRRKHNDRYVEPGEEWETTYNAGVRDSDLRKATEALSDLFAEE